MQTITLIVVILSVILNGAFTIWRTFRVNAVARQIAGGTLTFAISMEKRLTEVETWLKKHSENLEVLETLAVDTDNYTRKNRHAVVNLTQALVLAFPQLRQNMNGSFEITPVELEEETPAT